MSELQLSVQLIDEIQAVVAGHDERAKDPGITAQYLSAVIGLMLGNAEIPAEQKTQILDQLCGFTKQVMEDVSSQQQQQAPAQEEAFGVWKPGDA